MPGARPGRGGKKRQEIQRHASIRNLRNPLKVNVIGNPTLNATC
jgi:hypothetical protein